MILKLREKEGDGKGDGRVVAGVRRETDKE